MNIRYVSGLGLLVTVGIYMMFNAKYLASFFPLSAYGGREATASSILSLLILGTGVFLAIYGIVRIYEEFKGKE